MHGFCPVWQLAILASYSGDELAAIYRYFRSLAVDSPFSTARDNLIIAFEKVLPYLVQNLANVVLVASMHFYLYFVNYVMLYLESMR